MAVFKIIDECYVNEKDLTNLLHYCCDKAVNRYTYNLFDYGVDSIRNQFLYIQNCKGGELRTRALHYILVFDTQGWEHFMTLEKVNTCMGRFNALYFKDYQHLCTLHNKTGKLHFHVIVNPVSISNHKIFHMSSAEFEKWKKEIARYVCAPEGAALQSATYYDESGERKVGQEISGFMYQNRNHSWENL